MFGVPHSSQNAGAILSDIMNNFLNMQNQSSTGGMGTVSEMSIDGILYALIQEPFVFKPYVQYCINNILNVKTFDISFQYLDFMNFEMVQMIAFVQNMVRAIFAHGGLIVRPKCIGKDVLLFTNWDDVESRLRLISLNEFITPHMLLTDKTIRIFSSTHMPVSLNSSVNRFNGIFSGWIQPYLNISKIELNFLIGSEESVKHTFIVRPTKDFLEAALKMMLKGEQDKNFVAYIQQQAMNRIEAQINETNNIRNMDAGTNFTGHGYERRLLREINDINKELREDSTQSIKKHATMYTPSTGVQGVEIENSNIVTFPIGVDGRLTNPISTGKDTYFHLIQFYKDSVADFLRIREDYVRFIKKMREDIEEMINVLFTYYLTPQNEIFKSVIYENIEEELQKVEEFYRLTYIVENPIPFKDRPYTVLYGHLSEERLIHLKHFFNFSLMESIDEETLKDDINEMRGEYVTLQNFYVYSLKEFKKNMFDKSILRNPSKKPVIIKWGSDKDIESFVSSSSFEPSENASRKKRKIQKEDDEENVGVDEE